MAPMIKREAEVLQMLQVLFTKRKTDLVAHRVLLFGSRARGKGKQRSDFDLAVDGPAPLPLKCFYDIAEDLENLPTLYSFDWIDLNTTNDRFRDEVLKSAQVIYEG